MDRSHRFHEPGTDSKCRDCRQLAYEPSWYASLLTFAQTQLNEPFPQAPARA